MIDAEEQLRILTVYFKRYNIPYVDIARFLMRLRYGPFDWHLSPGSLTNPFDSGYCRRAGSFTLLLWDGIENDIVCVGL
jgi:hypothetical protein